MAVRQRRPAAVLKLFAEAFLANGGQVANAAIAAGVTGTPKSLSVKAARLHRRARESGLLDRRLAEITAAMGADETVQRLSIQARADMGQHLQFNAQGGLVGLRVRQEHTGIIREFVEEETRTHKDGETTTEVRTKRLKVADPLPALQTLAKIHGLERGDTSGPTNVNIEKLLLIAEPKQLAHVYRGVLGGGNGHGSHQ